MFSRSTLRPYFLRRLGAQVATFFRFLVGLGVAGLHLGEGEVVEHTHDGRTRSEVDTRLLDERVAVVLFGHGSLAGDANLKATEVAESDDFATLAGIGDDIFECHEHRIDVALMHGTSLLDAFGHFADVDVARSLHVPVELRGSFLVTRVDTRGYGVSYVSCHSVFEL